MTAINFLKLALKLLCHSDTEELNCVSDLAHAAEGGNVFCFLYSTNKNNSLKQSCCCFSIYFIGV